MKKSKDEILSFVRGLLTAIGSFFAGKMLFGTTVDEGTILGIVGALVAAASAIWGIIDKTATVEQFQSGIKSLIIVGGGFLMSAGIIRQHDLDNIIGLAIVILPMAYSWLSKKKSQQIADGRLPVANLSGVDEKRPQEITPRTTGPKN